MKLRTATLAVLILLSGSLFIATQPASAAQQLNFTNTTDFDNGTKVDAGANYFADNGVDQPSNWIAYPNSAYRSGKTFVAWQGDENYSMYVNAYDHTLEAWGTAKRVVNGATENPVTGDGHGSPALLIDANGFLHLFCCSHDTAIQHYKSNAILDHNAWTEKPELTGALTYPHPALVGNDIYVLYRTIGLPNGPWAYRRSTDGGETFGSSTTYLDFSATGGTAYVGGTEVRADQIHQFFVWHRNTDSERYNAYEIWLNTTDGNVYCGPELPVSQGPVIIKAEADAGSCIVTSTFGLDLNTNFGGVHLDSNGKAYVMWRIQPSPGLPDQTAYQVWFANSTASGTWSPQTLVVWTDNWQNFHDFIVNSPANLEAYIITNTTGAGAAFEGGDLQRWTLSGGTWTLAEIVLREASSGKPLDAPVIPTNHHPDFEVFFNQRHFDVQGDPIAGAANARLYAFGNRGFLFNPAFSFGPKGVETNTDIPPVTAGEFQLASSRSDRFSNADEDGVTYKWGNLTSPQYGSNSALFNWSTSVRTISGGELNVTLVENGGNVRWGIISTATLNGNFDVSIRTFLANSPSPSFAGGFYLNLFNEPVLDGFSPASLTVDGVLYYRDATTALQTYTVTNGVETLVGTTDNPANPLLWVRISKVGTTITWFYRTTDSGAWTTDQVTTFATDTNLFVVLVVWNNDVTNNVQYGFDNYNVDTSGNTVNAPGFRPSGSWSTPIQTYNGEVARSIVVNYTGATTGRFIDTIAIVSNDTGAILAADFTDRTNGTTTTFTISDNDLLSLYGHDWFARVTLVGDGSGSVAITAVVVNTQRSVLEIAVVDIPWIFGFLLLITLGLMGAWAIKKRRD